MWKWGILLVLGLNFLVVGSVSLAQVRSSSNYQLQSDSVNFGGGLSSSTSYQSESTVGEVATGRAVSNNYQLRAGYQQMQEVYLALIGGANVSMSPSLSGITGGEANGSTTVTAITDSPSGYQLTIKSVSSPALRSGSNSFADYSPSGLVPDLHFSTDATEAHFGYSPFGSDVAQRFLTNGGICDVAGSASTTACWDGLSTTDKIIAQDSSPNQPAGAATIIYFKAALGSAVVQPAGIYVATTTVTLMSL